MFQSKRRYYYKSILLVFFILIPVFLFSCSDPQTAPNQQDKEIPTQLIAPTSALNQQSALKLSRQIKLLTKYSKFDSEIVTISDTNSMVPVLDDNSIAIIEKIGENNISFNSLHIGDIIVYKCNNKDSMFYNKNIIHRIYNIDLDKSSLRAKGDNCSKLDDQEIKPSDIVGRVFCIIYCSESIK